MTSALPGDPQSWRELRSALRNLMARTETTALAVERRSRGQDSISDATVGRKLADSDAPLDARSLRIIVSACARGAREKGLPTGDADLEAWLAARTRLVEGPPPEPPPVKRPRRLHWIGAALAVVLLAGADVPTVEPVATRTTPCRNGPDRPAVEGLSISTPKTNAVINGDEIPVAGTIDLHPDEKPWLLLYAVGQCRFYIVSTVRVDGTTWHSTLYVDPAQHGPYGAYVVVVDATTDQRLYELQTAGGSPFVDTLPAGSREAHVTVRCCT
ncbi:hypothetical protein [Lentzea sp. NPDC004782]|uniref:hypothetical protein n=1 Tax=Lentzea sp. NPDC004782 TaxID=3154458 RepID=UPI0033B33F99